MQLGSFARDRGGIVALEKGLVTIDSFPRFSTAFSREDIEAGAYVHLCENLTREDLLRYFTEFQAIFSTRSKSSYKHVTKFRGNADR